MSRTRKKLIAGAATVVGAAALLVNDVGSQADAATTHARRAMATTVKAAKGVTSDVSQLQRAGIDINVGVLIDVADDGANHYLAVGKNGTVDFTGTAKTDATMMSLKPAQVGKRTDATKNRVTIAPPFYNEDKGAGSCVTDTPDAGALALRTCKPGDDTQVWEMAPLGDSGQFEMRGSYSRIKVENGRITNDDTGYAGLATIPFDGLSGSPLPSPSTSTAPPAPAQTITVPVYVHYIRDGVSKNMTRARAEEHVAALNDVYSGAANLRSAKTPFRFELRDVDWSDHKAWFDADLSPEEQAAIVGALHVGDAATLNAIVPSPPSRSTSTGSYPWALAQMPKQDAVVYSGLGFEPAPEEAAELGLNPAVLVHEVGHWLGLRHTFEGGCEPGPGDDVDDTPAHLNQRVEPGADTCPDLPGKDPLDNYMTYDYHGDLRFTPGQAERMLQQWQQYRAN